MTDLYQKIVSQRSGFERILARIPGFRGYTEMTARREADRMIREHIVTLLKEQMQRFIAAEKQMLSKGGLSAATKTREAKAQFQIFIDRVNTAAPGYAGFYAAQKIGPEQLEKIYAFDAALIEYVDHFRTAIEAFDAAARSGEGMDEAISKLEMVATEANAAFNMRDNVVTEIS
ncbi:MAG: hypothetical protein RML95_07440 [Anaerolineae bacterium]|nr:hypothetical protein [Anaerolineae bacterium]MDW8299157.1 hypothetical protein [Anaerolineae bacterium]